MKVVGINGSPKKEGNTRVLLEAVLAPLAKAGWETEIVQVGGKNIHGCRACGQCWEQQDNQCASGKDDFNAVFERMRMADAIARMDKGARRVQRASIADLSERRRAGRWPSSRPS